MIRSILFLIVISLGISTSGISQITTGSITMEITELDVPEMEGGMGAQMSAMMKDMAMIMHFKPDYQVTEISMMGMVNIKQHYEDNVMTQYMDVMGQKIKVLTPMDNQLEDLKKLGVDVENIEDLYQITYDKSDTKEILGYDCHKANIKMDLEKMSQGGDLPEEMKSMNMVMYVTDKIEMKQFSMQGIPGLNMIGTPLEFSMNMGIMKMTYSAVSFDDNPDKSVFEKPAGEYQEMSMEDLQNMGMGNGGFGF